MSLTFKLGSLAIRTLAKPLSNYIKRNATQHDNFRAICVGFAQRLHRVDMRLRLGLLQDPAAIERQIQRELKEAERKRIANAAPTVKNEAETLADEAEKSKERKEVEDHVKAAHKPPRIRPLSENKAIETGANFIAETFLFLVAGGLILAESWRRDRKEKKQDAEVADAIKIAETEREEMREKLELLQAEIEALMDEKRPFDEVRKKAVASLHKPLSTLSKPAASTDEAAPSATTKPVPISSTSDAAATTPSKAVAAPPTSSASPEIPPPMPIPASTKPEVTRARDEGDNPSSKATTPTSSTANTHPNEASAAASSWLPTSWLGSKNSKSSDDS